MMKRKKLVLFLLPFLLLTCSMQKTKIILVDIREGGNRNMPQVMVGDIIQIQLEGNPTTGYIWETEKLNLNFLEMTGDPVYMPASNLKGSKGTYTFLFRALSSGHTQLILKYHRPFEKNVSPERLVEIPIKIHE
jgi:inhibitor of cysteine peptidase